MLGMSWAETFRANPIVRVLWGWVACDMKWKIALMGLLGASMMASAQESHFEDFKWREKDTDHFLIRAYRTGPDPASKLAEKIWTVCVDVLPGLTPDFEKNEFETPSGKKGAEEAPFKFCIYLVDSGADFRELVKVDAARNGWGDNSVRLIHQVGNFTEPNARYTVYCKGDPMQSAGGDRDVSAIVAHSTGSSILRGRARSAKIPFWMQAGFGYYVEHMIFDLCRVHYLDFEAYYEAQNAEIKKGETLGADEDWPSVLRKMCKDEDRCSLQDVLTAQILTLSPKESGYIFALTYFLVRDDESKEKYQKLVGSLRDGDSVTQASLLETYGYADAAEMEAAWYEWMESRAFK